MDIDALGFT